MKLEELMKQPEYRRLLEDLNLEEQLLFVEYAGSYAYGTWNEESDIDIRGVFLPELKELLSCHLKKERKTDGWIYSGCGLEQFQDPHTDTVFYSLQKFFQLAAAGNPNMLELLGPAKGDILLFSGCAELLFENANLFLSKKVYYAIHGYSQNALRQLSRMEENQASEKKMNKQAMQIVRILKMGIEILQYGLINTSRKKDLALLQKIRSGAFLENGKLTRTYLDMVFDLKEELYNSFLHSRLPEQCDPEKLEALYLEIVYEFYAL